MKDRRMSLRNHMIGAGLFLLVTIALVAARRAGAIAPDIVERGVNVMIGLYFIIIGNYMPKTIEKKHGVACRPSRVQSLQRFSGWIFVIMGFVYAGAALLLPVEQAETFTKFVLIPGVVLVMGRMAWVWFTCKRGVSTSTGV